MLEKLGAWQELAERRGRTNEERFSRAAAVDCHHHYTAEDRKLKLEAASCSKLGVGTCGEERT